MRSVITQFFTIFISINIIIISFTEKDKKKINNNNDGKTSKMK